MAFNKSASVFGDCKNVHRDIGGDRIMNGAADVSSKIAVEVDNDYRYFSRDKLLKYFGKRRNGGGYVKSLIYPYQYRGHSVAVIEFEDRECAEQLIKKKVVTVTIRRTEHVTLNIIKFDEVMTIGSISLNHALFERIKSTFPDSVDEIQDECDVKINENAYVMEGEWYKLVNAKKRFDALICCDQPRRTVPPRDEIPVPQGQNNSSNALEVDCYLLDYIKMRDGDNLIQMITDYDVEEETDKTGRNTVTLKFPNSDAGKQWKEIFEDMLKKARRNSVRGSIAPTGHSDNKINQAMEMVRDKFHKTVYMCNIHKGSSRSILFIGPTKAICSSAISEFESAIGDETSIRSDEDNSIEISCYKFCDNELVLRILRGNIIHQSTTAIVNAANAHLHDGGGVTGAIYNAGGNEFRRRCREVMEKRNCRPLEMGEVLMTEGCGRLMCKSVLHAAGPKYQECKSEEDCLKKLQMTCYQIFAMADSKQFKSVSIPAMGTGIYGVPIPVFCKAFVQSIKEICVDITQGRFKYLKEIRLVNFDRYEANQIASRLASELRSFCM